MDSSLFISAFLRRGQRISAGSRWRLAPAALAAGSLVGAAVLLSACSDVPDEINPVSWYKGVEGWFSDEDETPPESVKNGPATKTTTEAKPAAQTAQNRGSGGSNEAFPTVQEVPEKPMTSTVEQRRQMMQGLSADRANAHYQDEAARASDQAAGAPGAGTNASSAPTPSSNAAPAKNSAAAPPALVESDSMMPTVPPPAAASSSPTAPAASPPSHKSYMTGLDTGPSPASPPAPPAKAPAASAASPPAAPTKAEAVTPAAPGSAELNQVYEAKLKESAPTVSTTPVGPMATASPPAGSVAEPPATPEVPATGKTKASAKKHAKTKSSTTAATTEATSPSVYVAPEVADGDLAVGQSPGFGAEPIYDGTGSGAPGQVGVVYFGSGSAEIDAGDVAKLRQVAEAYRQRGGNIRVVGYASSYTRDMDPMHHQMVNFNVSVRRADAVARELTKLGVKPANIFVSARSDSEPVYLESMPAGQAGNQRAEIFIDY